MSPLKEFCSSFLGELKLCLHVDQNQNTCVQYLWRIMPKFIPLLTPHAYNVVECCYIAHVLMSFVSECSVKLVDPLFFKGSSLFEAGQTPVHPTTSRAQRPIT